MTGRGFLNKYYNALEVPPHYVGTSNDLDVLSNRKTGMAYCANNFIYCPITHSGANMERFENICINIRELLTMCLRGGIEYSELFSDIGKISTIERIWVIDTKHYYKDYDKIEIFKDIGCFDCSSLVNTKKLTNLKLLKLTGRVSFEAGVLDSMRCLEELDLSCCEIGVLPDEFSKLRELKRINIRYSSITQLPKSIYDIAHQLEEFDMDGTKIYDEFPTEIQEDSGKSQLHYYFQNYESINKSIIGESVAVDNDDFLSKKHTSASSDAGTNNFYGSVVVNQYQGPVVIKRDTTVINAKQINIEVKKIKLKSVTKENIDAVFDILKSVKTNNKKDEKIVQELIKELEANSERPKKFLRLLKKSLRIIQGIAEFGAAVCQILGTFGVPFPLLK